ncbi:MAG: tRNA pseudouridine(13) synthase TruD [Candidatus Diapherotrites archaeon]|uniref:Probable tRNA pseudouridine synthase D n=1 Tax=Candidatus Iainarchaeum sp. TaxID=3101447 RepID=A0A2D6M1B1_9ARCH|nr:tRNA pseudouridine(13) synthase TruD [Candidatus Diapherotrites archaeon]|tara:strand:- start:687 stop:1946 length:1260 start_codon:yes stop_codon:yes gene_type:complete
MVEEIYSTKCQGIGGQIKRRYTDFVVEEITPDEKVCEVKKFLGDYDWAYEESTLDIPENKKELDFIHLDMEKINKDVNYCIRIITRFLQCSKKRVGYAGLKDKRGVTCQRISIYQPDLERLARFNSRGIDLRNPKWSKDKIEIGSLSRNRFTIVIRDLETEEKELKTNLEKCFAEIEKTGIANFFGEQRFGGIRKVTHLVGKEFITGNPEKAVMLYLTATCPKEDEDIRNARLKLFETRDFSEASKAFPSKYRYERALIHHLCKYPSDFVGAFRQLPKALCYLFSHAYQSYLFNEIIEERIKKKWGLKKVKGDILLNGEPTAPLLGFESKFAKREPGEIEAMVLEREKISLENFRVKEFPELSSKGARKSIVLKPQKLELLEIGDDEFSEGKKMAKISFELEKGSYATTVLREIMKVEE